MTQGDIYSADLLSRCAVMDVTRTVTIQVFISMNGFLQCNVSRRGDVATLPLRVRPPPGIRLTCSPVCLPDKALKETLDQVLLSGYFDRIPSHQNGVCEEEEDEEPASVAVPAAAESSEAEEQTVDPGRDQRFSRVIPHRTLM